MGRRIHCGINIDPANPHGRPSVQQLQDLGATWVRFTFKDDSDGPYPTSFPFYDDLVQELDQAGINVLMILTWETFPGKPARDTDEATWDAYIAEFAARCAQIAQHYDSQVQAYEIWNEPDSLAPPLPDYDPWLRPKVLGRLLRAAFMGIKEVASATVVMGGLASGQPSYLEQVRASTGGELYVDAVGIHPYGRRPTEDWPHPDWGFGVLGDLIQDYYAVARKPIWLTEVGTDDTSVQGQFPWRAFEAVNEDLAEIAPYVFWFCWSDGMVPPFGLVDEDGRRKASYTSFRAFASLPLEGIMDRPSMYSSDRQRQHVRYIVVHSTNSPVGVPAKNTLDNLVGPNDQEASTHELVLAGGQVYRLVPDERAAYHCRSNSVCFPDGTPSHLADKISWGIQAYQVAGRPVGAKVRATLVERVAAACRRLGRDSSHVLGHREIDPSCCQDPVGVDMDELRAAVGEMPLEDVLLAEAEMHQVIQFNPGAALQKHIFADGFVPNSPEFEIQINNVRYQAQRAEHLGTGRVRVYYAEVEDWSNVRFVEGRCYGKLPGRKPAVRS
jgi:N-acetyl-anhydromuramyl-L-alanine amidase AmpD